MGIIKKIFESVELAFVAMLVLGAILGVASKIITTPSITLAFFYVFYFAVALTSYHFLKPKLESKRFKLMFILIATGLIRLITIYAFNLNQIGDYNVYLTVADQIAHGLPFSFKYYGVFPHAVHYPMFMSVIFKVIPSHGIALALVNFSFSIVEGLFVFLILDRLKPKRSVLMTLFVVMNPASILFVTLAGGEMLYSAVMMVAFYIILRLYETTDKRWYHFSLFGLVLGLANFFRPTALILLLAFLIEELLFNPTAWIEKAKRVGIVVVVFALLGTSFSFMTKETTGYPTPDKSFGWNMFVGANFYHQGQWNTDDAAIINDLFGKEEDPSAIQTYFFEEGLKRYKALLSSKDSVVHVKNKFKMWVNETTIPYLLTEGQHEGSRFPSRAAYNMMVTLLSLYHLTVFLIMIVGMFYHKLQKNRTSFVRLLTWYMCGTFCMFVLLEQAARYKGAYYGMMTLFAVITVDAVLTKRRELKHEV